MKPKSAISTIETYILLGIIILIPITVVTSFANVFVTGQIAMITFGIGAILLLKSLKVISKNKLSISAGTFDISMVLLAVVYLASTILQTPNKMEGFFLPGTATIVIAGALLYFIVNQADEESKKAIKLVMFLSGVIFSLIVLFATAGVFRSIPQLPLFIQSQSFNTMGGALPSLIFLAAIAPIAISYVINEKIIARKAFFGVSASLLALAWLISLLNVLPGKPSSPQLPGFGVSWSVAIDSLKTNPLLGVGPGNYISAFNQFRPISYNSTKLWSVRFTSAQNFFFTAITETGLAGAAALIITLYTIYKLIIENQKHKKLVGWSTFHFSSIISLGILTLALMIFPATPTLLFVFFIMLALNSKTTQLNLGMFSSEDSLATRLPILVITVPVIIGVLAFGYFGAKVLGADITFKNGLNDVARNDGKSAYTNLQMAIQQNPYVDRYRISYAQVNLALANSIAQKEDISDEDRTTIAQLIQQAIREGKVAVALNPTRAGNWEVLASIYRTVIPLAEGADAFAIQTYNQAVNLDPLNPNTRIALGGIYYGAGQFKNAIDIFRLAVLAKSDHANARFNLASAYKEDGQLQKAIDEMSVVLSLVDRNSDDYELARKTLEDLQNKKTETESKATTNLTPPQAQEPVLQPPLELPEDAQPPKPESTPTPSESPEAKPTASPSISPTPTPLP